MSFSDIFSAVLKVRRFVAIATVIGGAGYKLAPMVWHKAEARPVAARIATTNSIAANSSGCDLGEVTLTNHSETCVKLGGGKDCILSPKVLDGNNLQITFALESKSTAGKIHDLSVAQVVTQSGKSVDVAFGTYNITLTPLMASE
jgi:hypothetical protein